MPCVYDDFGEAAKSRADEIKRLEALLCGACKRLFGNQKENVQDPDYYKTSIALTEWWVKHMSNDAIRIQKKKDDLERKKQKALDKLTYEDKKLLGLVK